MRSKLLGALLASSLAFGAHAQDLANHTIKIGVLTDFSSQYAAFSGKFTLAGVQMAAEDFMKAHPNRKVEVVFADHQNKPDIGSTIVRQWLDRDGVDMIADLATSAIRFSSSGSGAFVSTVSVDLSVAVADLTVCSRFATAYFFSGSMARIMLKAMSSVVRALPSWNFMS